MMKQLSDKTKFVTNKNDVMSKVINIYMPHSDKLDFLVGYFYFSGFESIYKQIGDKPMRILVGMDAEVDLNNCICELVRIRTGKEKNTNNLDIRNEYYESLKHVINNSDNTDTKKSSGAFSVFINKIMNGTLEVRKTREPNHAKMYLFYNDAEMVARENTNGCLLVGSSNLSYEGISDRSELNVRLLEGNDFNDGSIVFNELWDQSTPLVDKNTKDEFEKIVLKNTWLMAEPTPYLMYVRVLYEYFKENTNLIKTPSEITKGNISGEFSDFQYQLDAIRDGIAIVKKHSGCIISDVVGLGKSVIASCIAANLDKKVVIVCPPHLKKQWSSYSTEFGLKGTRIYTPGILKTAVEENSIYTDQLVIIDEAHRYRNENTEAYAYLHQLCAGNQVLLLTATPFNNQPSDIFSLIKLFQIPSKSTIQTVDNLGQKMYTLVQKFKVLKREHSKRTKTDEEFQEETKKITEQIKMILNPIVIRRTRIDLLTSEKYKEDLKQQNIEFSEIQPPVEQTYDLEKMTEIYVSTLDKLTNNASTNDSFIGTKYEPLVYVINNEKNNKKYSKLFDNENFRQGQHNMASFMKQLIVRRFESSVYSFKMTVDTILKSMENTKEWYERYGKIPLFKKGNMPDFDDFENQVDESLQDLYDDVDDAVNNILSVEIEKGLIFVQKEELDEKFIKDLNHDIALFKSIKESWPVANFDNDPKLQGIVNKITTSIKKEPNRKIIIFSEFADTVTYLYNQMKNKKLRVMYYTSEVASENNRELIRVNFDAGYPENLQKNDYDILVATDSISEGFSLHRAGTIYNYDILYNPTRVIQRVGRINRINKKVFDNLNIYNFFPSATGEAESHTKEISTFKMLLISSILGSDTKVLTSDEEISGYMTEQFRKAQGLDEELNWKVKYENELRKLMKNDPEIITKAKNLPFRCRIGRKSTVEKTNSMNELFKNLNNKGTLVFSKKGDSYKFSFADEIGIAMFPGDEAGLKMFEAEDYEKPLKLTDSFYSTYEMAKNFSDITRYKQERTDNVKAADDMLVYMKKCLTDNNEKEYIENCRTLINDYGCIPVYVLKQVALLQNEETISDQYKSLQNLLPLNYVDKLMSKKDSIGNEPEKILLAEQMQ
jgi:ERCC4-related helicase